MTKQQITKIGIPTDTWNKISALKGLQFSNDGLVYTSPTTEFYFSSDGLIFVRYLKNGIPINGGCTDNVVGKYHDVYDLDELILVF